MNTSSYNLQRFITAQHGVYNAALAEIKSGRKRTHWMWFIFPQLAGLGKSETAQYYAIKDINEAAHYLSHPLLGKRLIEICEALMQVVDKNAHRIFGSLDDLKLHSCITLFSLVPGCPEIFSQILDEFFEGKPDAATIQLLNP